MRAVWVPVQLAGNENLGLFWRLEKGDAPEALPDLGQIAVEVELIIEIVSRDGFAVS